jgi:RHS repeat-associated protein
MRSQLRMTGGRSGWVRAVAGTAIATVLAGALSGMSFPHGGDPGGTPAGPRNLPASRPVPVHPAALRKIKPAPNPAWHRPAQSWPAAGQGLASLAAGSAGRSAAPPAASPPAVSPPATPASSPAGRPATTPGAARNALMAGVTAGSQQAGALPVWVGPAAAGRGGTPPSKVSVVMQPWQAAKAAGIGGVIFTVARGDGGTGDAPVHVSLDYQQFAYADGGNFAARLHLVQLPACVLTTPGAAACRQETPLGSGDDVRTTHLGADVTLPGGTAGPGSSPSPSASPSSSPSASPSASPTPTLDAALSARSDAVQAAGPAVVMAVVTSTSGSAGSFSATPLQDSGTWSESGSSGAFTYSYPIPLPPVPGGLAPQVSLNYNSQVADGLTSSTNDQASWIGDGWDYAPGYVERDYEPCSQTSANTGDLCWSSNNTTSLVLNGQDIPLVNDPTNGWHEQADNGDLVTYKTGAGSNGTHDDDYWVVTDPDGTSYYFGMNELPGFASGDAQTNSAFTVPVYATASGQPCFNATFAKASCAQAWRWNLDYETDSRGNAIGYFYNTETNFYAPDKGTTATASYIQAGVVSKIEYGLRSGSVYGTTPAGEVTFTAAADRTDVPASGAGDLACSSGAACNENSPTFWGKFRLTTIATQALSGTALEPADSWALAQDYPNPSDATTAPSLWLESITRTGHDGSASITLPAVSFTGTPLANRAETPADESDGYSLITRLRMKTVTNETGGVLTVTYDNAPSSCTSGNFPAQDTNTTVCYPDFWTPPGASAPVQDWFNKYVITAVTQTSTVASADPVATTYCYGTAPGCLNGAAWHYNDDPLLKSSQRTWDQFRGFASVTTETGTAPDPVTKTVSTYFEGMDGDTLSGGGTSTASLTSTVGGVKVTDANQWAGDPFEHIVYDGASGPIVSDTVTTPYTSAATATQTGLPAPLPSMQAFLTGTAETRLFTALASGGYRESDDIFTHDSAGRVITEANVPDAADNGAAGNASLDTCTQNTYDPNTSPAAYLLDLPGEVIKTAEPPASCPVSGTPAKSVLLSDTRHYYDGATSLTTPPTAGNLTETTQATSYSGSSEVFTTESLGAYDQYGRTTSATDADGHVTTTAYTPASGAEPTSQTVTDPMNLTTTTTFDPVRDLPLTVTNPAGLVTTEAYDALGRLASAWTAGHPATGPADETFSYALSTTGPSVITTNTINDAGSYIPSETLYDSLGRPVETQTETADGGADVADTTYNSDNWKLVLSNPYYASSAPSATLVAAADDQVPSQTGYFYDGAGRVTRQVSYSLASETRETDTAYGGNYTTITPPSGGTAETTYTDGNGQDSYVYQYHSAAPPATPPAPGSGPKAGAAGWDQTAYTDTPLQQLATVTDATGDTWSYFYDLNGDEVSAADPDAGTSSSTYDANGNMLSSTDARGKTVSYTYDADGRKAAEYDTTGGAAPSGSDQLAAWTYDTLAKGEPTSSTSYVGGTTGSSYTQGVTGYNAFGLPKGTDTIVSSGPLAGTYKQLDAYTSDGNLESEYQDQAVGGLPLETVQIGHNTVNQQVAVGSSLWDYVSQAAYTELGQPQQYAMGPNAQPAWLTYTYNQETGQLASSQLQAGTSPVTLDDTTYAYNPAGAITSETDAPSGGPAQVQCFSYDYLGRLSQAWAQGSSGCASAMSQSAEASAAAPYWNQYTYDTSGDLTGATATPASGAATTTTSTFPAAGSPQPHALTAQKSAGPAGTATTSYGYNAAGDTTSIAGPSSTQSLSWNDAGQLTSDTTTGTGAGTTSYAYDADGNLLMQTDPGTITLYLPDEQVVYNTAAMTTTATRFYSINGKVIAARSSTGSVTYLDTNQQGTGTVSVDSQALTATHRYYDPYGNPVGTVPSNWPGTRGFVGGTADSATGLTNLGAREYNPATGAFISPDQLISPGDPQNLNAYAYALDDPASQSDPSGQMVPGQSYRVNPGPGSVPTPGQETANQPSSQPSFTARASDSCGIMCSEQVRVLNLLDPVTTPVRTHRVRQVSTGISLGSVFSASCPGRGCTPAFVGLAVSSLGASLAPAASNIGKLRVLQAVYRGISTDSPLVRNMSEPWRVPKLRSDISDQTNDLLKVGSALKYTSYGLNVGGGVVEGYGEYSRTNGDLPKSVAVGAADVGVNFGAAQFGTLAAGAVTSALAGAEDGALIGASGGPLGAAVGAVVGALVGAGFAWAGGNLTSDVASWF